MEILHIPTSQVGKLIGKSGETIRNLQLSTDTRIQVRHGAPAPGVLGPHAAASEHPGWLRDAPGLRL